MSLTVLHVVESMSAEAGSIAISLRGLFAALAARDIRSDVLVSKPGPTSSPSAKTPDYVTHDVNQTPVSNLVAGCDLVHLHGWGTSATARAAAKAARARQTPYILSPLGSLCPDFPARRGWKDRLRERFFDASLISSAAAITAVTDAEADHLTEDRKLAAVMVLPYGLDFSAYQNGGDSTPQAPPSGGNRCLLVMGPVAPWAGQALLLKSFAEIGSGADGWDVAMAGSDPGDWRRPLEAAVRRKGGTDRVTFAEANDQEAQCACLARASLLVAPAMHVDHCVSALQALAARVPLLISDRIAPPAMNGSVEVFDPTRENLKKALRATLCLDDDRFRDRATQAYETARTSYDWPNVVDRFVDLYRGLR